jgi:hypothetical protein
MTFKFQYVFVIYICSRGSNGNSNNFSFELLWGAETPEILSKGNLPPKVMV